ncbi:X-ray radiation resistance-associated protein 1-like isoform X2 [Bolinopsis microptera]|uniref:X-ray radiation resistance-associated protein 1-like isoform X2 n=1 Tax=Bolinopsis microptera TaxID=2820187 RepID=UPI003079EBA6
MTELHTADFLPAFDGLIPAFPAHSLTRKKQILTEGGAWLVEHQEAQHRRYHSFLLYDQDYIQHRQQEAEKQLGEKILDGYYLLNCAKLDDPQDICSIDISNQGLNAAKEDDFDLFINLFHINAAENNLKLECLSSFPMVREIQFQFNSLSKVKLSPNHFLHLDTLDLSYNQISHSGILNIGLIERLRVLVLTANEIKTLPSNMAYPAVDNEKQIYQRFANLEELYLDNNHLCDLSTFATLGALKKLKYLNLAKNHIYYIPHLRVLGSAIAHVEDFKAQNKSAKSTRTKSQRSSANSQKMKQEISNSEFGLTKSKITPIQTKTPKKLIDVLPGKDDNSEDSPDVLEDDTPESEISTPDLEDETPTIRDKKPISRPEEEDIETGVSRGDSPASLSREQIVHVGSSSAFPGGSVKSGMMERDMNKSDSPDAIRKNKLNVDAYLISEGKSTAETMYQTAPMPLQQPFPQLQTLILSDNVISEEEGVLACALWPKLCQLVLHNNPVITQCRGLPILLTHELTLRNGITIIRNPPSKVKKPPSVTVSAGTRRIKEPPRPLPRQPHPELLTLESAPSLALPPTTAGSSVPPISPSVSLPEAQKEAPEQGLLTRACF